MIGYAKISLGVAAMLVLAGCWAFTEPVLLGQAVVTPHTRNIRHEWESYDAYYAIDELFVEASFQDFYVKTPMSKVIVNKVIEILTPEGAEYASVAIPRYTAEPSSFDVQVIDSEGRPVSVDVDQVREEYEDNGVVVVPNVVAGCQVRIQVTFVTLSPVSSFEHWFSREIPVERGRFTFSSLHDFMYDVKSYGGLPPSTRREAESGRHTYRIWSVKDLLPRSRVDHQATVAKDEQRVALVLRRAFSQDIISTWADVAESYREYALQRRRFSSTRLLSATVDSLTPGLTTEREKAEAVLTWVQENLSTRGGVGERVDPDKVIESRQGTYWDITLVLREMLEHLGLRTDILVTRGHSKGGFDQHFVNPATVMIPLVTVRVTEREYVAFPFVRGGMLGEYPHDYFDLHGLSLRSERPHRLPEPLSRRSLTSYAYTLDFSADPPRQDVEIQYGGYMAYWLRSMLLTIGEEERKEFFQKVLTGLGQSNALKTYEVEGLEHHGGSVKAHLSFHNPTQSIRRKGKMHVNLSHLFREYFDTYDSSRTTTFSSRLFNTVTEAIRLVKPASGGAKVFMVCTDLANDLFEATCTQKDSPVEYSLVRVIDIKKADLPAGRMRAIYPDIVSLNRVAESSVVIERRPSNPQ